MLKLIKTKREISHKAHHFLRTNHTIYMAQTKKGNQERVPAPPMQKPIFDQAKPRHRWYKCLQ